MKILLTGANGLIGTRLTSLLNSHQVLGVDADTFDITDQEAATTFIKDKKPEAIIHLAAYTNTEKAEEERDLCWRVNVTGTENLLRAAAELPRVQFIYFSTDHVFSGERGNYRETDEAKPVNYYGETKLAAENLVAQLPNSLTLRISYPFRAKYEEKSDVVRWMLPRLANQEELHLVEDQYITPTFIDDLAIVLDKAMQYQLAGLYHAAGASFVSFYEMGVAIAAEFGYDKNLVKPINLSEFAEKAERKAKLPKNAGLDSSKLRGEVGFSPRGFADALKLMKEQLD